MSALSSFERRMWRSSLTAEALLTAEEAEEALPLRPTDAREWLSEHVAPSVIVAGVVLYRWRDVLGALAPTSLPTTAPGARPAFSGSGIAAHNGIDGGMFPPDPSWWSHQEVLAHLRVDSRTLKDRMTATAPHIPHPWVQLGTRKRPVYRWRASKVDAWWLEVSKWQASKNETANTASAGATRTGRRDRVNVRPPPAPSGCSGRSRKPSPKDDAGSLVTLVKSLTSERF